MRYWWVNQNQTYGAETRGSFMWSPKLKADGARNQFYENMREVSPGDVVFSYCVPEIRPALLDAWGIDSGVRVGEFSREQNAYLDYHRVNIFKG